MAILKEYHKPTSVPEALALLARTDINLVPLAGGTRLVGALETTVGQRPPVRPVHPVHSRSANPTVIQAASAAESARTAPRVRGRSWVTSASNRYAGNQASA